MIIYNQLCQLAIARLGVEKIRWTYIDARFHIINDIAYVEDKLYAVDIQN